MIYKRMLSLTTKNSLFLFGPRGAGKTSLVHKLFPESTTYTIDLLNLDWEERLAKRPQYLAELVQSLPDTITHVIIDEIQKNPKLLDVIHALIESSSKKFILTGSSAKKLKKAGVNLLAGRAFVYNLLPLSFMELGKDFELNTALSYGTLPKIYQLDLTDRASYLRSYAQVYLKEEIWNEHVVRKLQPFRRFLEVAAQCNGKIINMSNIARDVGVDGKTISSYYQILEDTLIGFFLEPFRHSFRKRLSLKPKFYFFDCGLTRALCQMLEVPLVEQTSYYGELFEHYIILETHRLCNYLKPDYKLSYLQTQNDVEVDLIIERPQLPLLLIEIKSSSFVPENKIKKLKELAESLKTPYEAWFLCQEPLARKVDGIHIFPWQEGLVHLFK